MSAGNLITQRTLVTGADGNYAPGQHSVRVIDPRPHRDRADLAAILTYVDDEQRACSVVCMRYRDQRGWKSITLHRATPKKIERTTVVGCLPLEGELLAVVEQAAADFIAEGRGPFPFEEPSEDERKMRALAHHLIDQIEAGR